MVKRCEECGGVMPGPQGTGDCTCEAAPEANQVDHPPHYTFGRFEVIEVLEDWDLGPHLFNVVKYVARAGKKDPAKEIQDLEKAAWYLNRRIELLKAAKEGRDACRPNDMVRK